MASVNSIDTFVLVIVSLVFSTTMDITQAKPAPSHEALEIPCLKKGGDHSLIASDIEIAEAKLWNSMKPIIVQDLNHAVDQIWKQEEHLQCDVSPKEPINIKTLNELKDFSQIKGLREASLAVYGDLLNLVAHLNVVVDNHGCWDDNMITKFKKLRSIIHPVVCDINGLLEAEVQSLLGEIIALKIVALGDVCSLNKTITCTLLKHIRHFAKGLADYNIPS